MLRLIDKKLKLLLYFFLFILLSTQITKNKTYDNIFFAEVNNIIVEGLSDKNNKKIQNSLKYLISENIFFIKESEFQNILNQNNLVHSFYIKKIYPNLIKVEIDQTDFLAITIKNNKKFYIGSNGKLISQEEVEKINYELPYVYTKINYASFIKLKKIIDQSEFNFEEISSFYFFPSDRWDFKTKDGFVIKLPKENIAKSLKIASLIKSNEKFKEKKIIDLRISSNIILSNE